MTTTEHRYQSDFARRYFSAGKATGEVEGEVKGAAKAVLTLLKHRGVAVLEEHRAIILECNDHEQLDAWLILASTADSIRDLGDEFCG